MPFALRHDDHEYSMMRVKSGMNNISLIIPIIDI